MSETLGIRCTNKSVSWALLGGSKQSPDIREVKTIPYPKGYPQVLSIKWLFKEVPSVLYGHDVHVIVIKQFEGRTKGQAYEDRVEHEAAIQIAASEAGVKHIFKRRKSTIAKELGQKGRASYLSRIDTRCIARFGDYDENEQEAILAAWSGLL